MAIGIFIFVLMASLCAAQVPQGQMVLNGALYIPGDLLSTTFLLGMPVTRPFTVFSVIVMPNGSMLDTRTLGAKIKPIASNVPQLNVPFQYQLLSLMLPVGAPVGQYEVVVAFFDPSQPITGRASAFLDVSSKFNVTGSRDWYTQYGPSGTGDVVQIGSIYVASRIEDAGCAEKDWKNWPDAMAWAAGLSWLERDDWRNPTKDELQMICNNKALLGSFTASSCWSSSAYDADYAWWLYFKDCILQYWGGKYSLAGVRAVRDIE